MCLLAASDHCVPFILSGTDSTLSGVHDHLVNGSISKSWTDPSFCIGVYFAAPSLLQSWNCSERIVVSENLYHLQCSHNFNQLTLDGFGVSSSCEYSCGYTVDSA